MASTVSSHLWWALGALAGPEYLEVGSHSHWSGTETGRRAGAGWAQCRGSTSAPRPGWWPGCRWPPVWSHWTPGTGDPSPPAAPPPRACSQGWLDYSGPSPEFRSECILDPSGRWGPGCTEGAGRLRRAGRRWEVWALLDLPSLRSEARACCHRPAAGTRWSRHPRDSDPDHLKQKTLLLILLVMITLTKVLLAKCPQLEVRRLALGWAGRGGELLLGVRGRGEAPGDGRVTPGLLGAGHCLAPTGLIHSEAHFTSQVWNKARVTALSTSVSLQQLSHMYCMYFKY